MARGSIVDEITRRIPFHGNLRYLYGGRSSVREDAMFRHEDPVGEAQREISFQPCFLAAVRSDELVFREIPGILHCHAASRKLLC